MAADKKMSGEEELPITQTPKEGESQDGILNKHKLPWGRLITCRRYLKSVDLIDSFSFGRSEECSLVVTTKSCPTEILYGISKKHFKIEKCHNDDLVYITDFSKNGSFVNKEKVGIGRRKILKHNDVIAVATPSNSIYIFLNQTSLADDFLPPDLVGKFANVRRLGRGSCGEVRLVKDRDTFKQYAIKKINLSESNTSQIDKINHPNKVFNEIYILKKLSHPCIVWMFDIVQLDRDVYLILEYMAGGELTTRIRSGPMSEDVAKFYFTQMVLATQYLHSQGIIHRDLKPENMLLLDEREATLLKITDFGLSKITNHSDATTMCGTLRYIAPEVLCHGFRHYGEYGKPVDTWSLGVILYLMVSREFPFKGESSTRLVRNILKCKYDLSNGIWSNEGKEEIKDLLKKILQVHPGDRPEIAQIYDHDWIKHDEAVKNKVRELLEQEGMSDPLRDLSLGPPPLKKCKYSDIFSSSSSDESDATLAETNHFHSSPTICAYD